ncbi:MAG: MgtC/SapB family protein [Burkholderiaceae bacterium]|nr:MgtC/SapB family protein [Burkholderiaceae bacterium]MEB2350123.1 MgtC/SapB family protein [Burkholderiaceae bacterium]
MNAGHLLDELFADPAYLSMALRLVAALAVGAAIGLERSYHGRPAGFRTHALVCLSTSLLMLVTIYENRWFPGLAQGRIALDPTRMAQGIMTGIGFLGAGTIMKEGPTVRGLTTAASIWITAAIGVLIGIGFYFPAMVATVLTLGTLSVFRWVEARMPAQFYAHFTIRFHRATAMPEGTMRELLSQLGFTVANLNYRLDAAADFFEYRMVIRTSRMDSLRRLPDALAALDSVREFRVAPTGD